ncbi:glycosyltransferase family 2 protein [Pedobacter sp. SD-b]|uniref:Glycosyltransferase family 2 protein n=1 Tax=Pedobacter segetis TaxID=2793069 RepID=A0ABS1BKR1_9SPHI|nr:glycosyltransferase family 2 protein [Pedobacter segetis]MBK0383479.1 glycosyltransferase family 2 protein [Pedobacter segetis]
MKLSIIIVSYNVRDLLQQALDSLIYAAININHEIFVVDNASKDATVEMVRNRYPTVKLIINKNNVGFSVANNQAISQAKGQYILAINPDTITSADTLQKTIKFMDKTPNAGGLGVRMINAQGKYLSESKRGLPTLWVSLCKFTGLCYLFPRSKIFNRYYMGWINEYETAEIHVLAGAFMLLRKQSLEKTGYFDESFFMYGEDVDLSYRLKLAGFKNYYFPETYIIHFKGQSTRKLSFRYIKSFYGAMFIFAKKHLLNF